MLNFSIAFANFDFEIVSADWSPNRIMETIGSGAVVTSLSTSWLSLSHATLMERKDRSMYIRSSPGDTTGTAILQSASFLYSLERNGISRVLIL